MLTFIVTYVVGWGLYFTFEYINSAIEIKYENDESKRFRQKIKQKKEQKAIELCENSAKIISFINVQLSDGHLNQYDSVELPFTPQISVIKKENNTSIRVLAAYKFDVFFEADFEIDTKVYEENQSIIHEYYTKISKSAYKMFFDGDKSHWKERFGKIKSEFPRECEFWYYQNGTPSWDGYEYVDRNGYYSDKKLRARQAKGELPLIDADLLIFDD